MMMQVYGWCKNEEDSIDVITKKQYEVATTTTCEMEYKRRI